MNHILNGMNDIKTIANRLGRKLTSKGNLELGANDQGEPEAPGKLRCNSAVIYYLLGNGDYRVVIDDRYGATEQGEMKWHGGAKTHLDGIDLNEVIQLAKEHIESLEDSVALLRAWRIASAQARATLRRIEHKCDMKI